jgi:hypothetical protein
MPQSQTNGRPEPEPTPDRDQSDQTPHRPRRTAARRAGGLRFQRHGSPGFVASVVAGRPCREVLDDDSPRLPGDSDDRAQRRKGVCCPQPGDRQAGRDLRCLVRGCPSGKPAQLVHVCELDRDTPGGCPMIGGVALGLARHGQDPQGAGVQRLLQPIVERQPG